MSFLIPTLDAYSNNPNKSGALPKTLYYLALVRSQLPKLSLQPADQFISDFDQDSVDKQPDEWREDNLPPKQLKGDLPTLKVYSKVMGELLKHQQSHLRVLVSL
jgi:hypothetical protein